MKAIWKNTVIAESDHTELVEGNHYFPHDSIKWEYFQKTELTSTCPWKGNAVYFSIKVNEDEFENGAWSYPEPKDAAKNITGHVAFYPQVEIV